MDLPITNSSGFPNPLVHYRLEGLVAAGGMASIFRATDTRTGRRVALKIPHPDRWGDPLVRNRLRHEAEIGSILDHPGLVKVLSDHGLSHRYMVMEWVDGRLLREIMDNERTLASERSIRIALAICDVLEYIHNRGIVHGDLKPDNVMVDRREGVKLIDFGIACEASASLWKRARHREATGTPDYASPEQIQGKRSDARSDVYSLGILLFEMLTGEVPFSGLDPVTAMNLRVLADPPFASEINPDISPRLEAVVHRAIARDRAKRYASAREIASNLSGLLAKEGQAQPFESLANI
jgi:eukaryotic-like serine/threonine-protein kinase